MKKLILLFVLIAGFCFGQNYEIKSGKFYTVIKDGSGVEKPVSFNISDEVIDKIKESEKYKNFLNDTQFIEANKIKRNMADEMTVYLFGEINHAVSITRLTLKNKTSFNVTENSEGNIRFGEKGIKVLFPFSAKNDLGNSMMKTSVVQNNKALFID